MTVNDGDTIKSIVKHFAQWIFKENCGTIPIENAEETSDEFLITVFIRILQENADRVPWKVDGGIPRTIANRISWRSIRRNSS